MFHHRLYQISIYKYLRSQNSIASQHASKCSYISIIYIQLGLLTATKFHIYPSKRLFI